MPSGLPFSCHPSSTLHLVLLIPPIPLSSRMLVRQNPHKHFLRSLLPFQAALRERSVPYEDRYGLLASLVCRAVFHFVPDNFQKYLTPLHEGGQGFDVATKTLHSHRDQTSYHSSRLSVTL